jgi:hypothetical protein
MKKLLLTLGFSAALLSVQACDICGCGVGNYNPYLFPHLSKSYLSMSYIHRYYRTHSESGISGNEYYNSLLLTAQFSIGKKFQVLGVLPYQVNQLVIDNETKKQSGAGDVSFLVNYRLLDKMSTGKRQSLLIGAGVKLPTGKYTTAKTEEIDDQNFQLGTGSIDYILSASYRITLAKWAFSAATSYKYNTQNKDDFRFGDVLTSGATAVYRIDRNKFSIAPYAQLTSEIQMKDAAAHVIQDHSGGNAFYTGAGIDVNTKKAAMGINYQLPVSQNMAEGQITVRPKLSAHLSFVLN